MTGVQPGNKKRMFLYAGIGFVAIGAVSIVLTYMFVYQPLAIESAGETAEFDLEEIHSVRLAMHDHVFLAVNMSGQPVEVPAMIGMSPQFWHDHSLDQYGPSSISPMHTHDVSGTIHIESTIPREYAVGEFLKVWGVDGSRVTKLIVDGEEVADFQNHVMKRGERLQLELTG